MATLQYCPWSAGTNVMKSLTSQQLWHEWPVTNRHQTKVKNRYGIWFLAKETSTVQVSWLEKEINKKWIFFFKTFNVQFFKKTSVTFKHYIRYKTYSWRPYTGMENALLIIFTALPNLIFKSAQRHECRCHASLFVLMPWNNSAKS